jgi:hypothetical protein
MAVQNIRATARRVTRDVRGSVVIRFDEVRKIYCGTQVYIR